MSKPDTGGRTHATRQPKVRVTAPHDNVERLRNQLALRWRHRPCRRRDRAGSTDFPESMTATAHGTLFFSSLAGGRIFRSAPGATQATEWIKQEPTAGLRARRARRQKSGTLYACSVDLSGGGVIIPTGATPGALKLFDLRIGAAKGSVPLPPSTSAEADGTVQRHRRCPRWHGLCHRFLLRAHPAYETWHDGLGDLGT